MGYMGILLLYGSVPYSILSEAIYYIALKGPKRPRQWYARMIEAWASASGLCSAPQNPEGHNLGHLNAKP